MIEGFLETLLRCYESLHNLVHAVKPESKGRSRSGTLRVKDILELGAAAAAGKVEIGDIVVGNGWLSPYAYWYLPKAYSPYRFAAGYVAVKGA